jgi:transposase InsO family protein
MQHAITSAGLTQACTHAFYLIIVDAYSRCIEFYGLPDKSSTAVVAAIKQYQADNLATDTYGYTNLEQIQTDAGSQFTSGKFAEYCIEHGICISLAAPKKQYQNHLAKHT